jgi:hypothetical protein
MPTELDVLRIVSDRLAAANLPFMLTGSFALAHYATPRMTRDLDIVVALTERDIAALLASFQTDFYIDVEAVRAAIRSERLFNLLHLESGIKVDIVVHKSGEYRKVEFARRQAVAIAGVHTWIVSREDLVLSKLVWSLDSRSELQRRDVRQLLAEDVDLDYIRLGAQTGRRHPDRRTPAMNDTSAEVAQRVAEIHRRMTPSERCLMAAAMFESARAIVESSLPPDLTREQRRLGVARRIYGYELSDAALAAHANFPSPVAD